MKLAHFVRLEIFSTTLVPVCHTMILFLLKIHQELKKKQVQKTPNMPPVALNLGTGFEMVALSQREENIASMLVKIIGKVNR